MTDRVPGAPGQYKVSITGEELQKLQNGEQFAITLTRDDQPIKEGTPYSKAAVLPDELAMQLCPEIKDPAPKDAFAALGEKKADVVQHRTGSAIAINNSANTPIKGLKLFGKTTQDGTPTLDAPVALESAGDSGSIAVKVTGKNLFPYNKSFTTLLPTEETDNQFVILYPNNAPLYIPGGTYVFSFDITQGGQTNTRNTIEFYGPRNGTSRYFYATTSENAHLDAGRYSYKFTLPEGTYRVRWWCNNIDVIQTVSNMQLEIGTAATDYEPYTEQTLTVATPNGLPGIPVASGGNYTDESGQQYASNCRIYDTGKDEKWVLPFTIDGTNLWDYSGRTKQGLWSSVCIIDGTKNYGSTIADRLPYVEDFQKATTDAICRSGKHGIIVALTDERTGLTENSTTEEVSTAFNAVFSQYPTSVLYQPIVPVESDILEDEIDAYATLHTDDSGTTVFNDAGAGMEVTYYTPSTAVQMVHSPADEGKVLSIDQHGCVVLVDRDSVTAEVTEEIDTVNAEIGNSKESLSLSDEVIQIAVNEYFDSTGNDVTLAGSGMYRLYIDEGIHYELFGKAIKIKTYAYGDMCYYFHNLVTYQAVNPDVTAADIEATPEKGICEFEVIFPEYDENENTFVKIDIPFCENSCGAELEIHEIPNTIWDEIKYLRAQISELRAQIEQ